MVRLLKQSDIPAVLQMMYRLWLDFDGKHDFEKETVFVWEEGGVLSGFITVSVRPWVDGAESAPCPHIEGWYVEPNQRKQGIGKALVKAAEEWCIQQGYTEITSDALLDNAVSISAHKAIGFQPTEQLQFFKKKLV